MLDTVKAPVAASVFISPPNFQYTTVRIRGDAPFVSNAMSSANREKMKKKQEAGSQAEKEKGKKRPPKDFDAIYKGSLHTSMDGWHGFPAAAIRAAMVDACRTVGFAMTRAKLCLFVVHDGIDALDGQPLVRIYGKPERRDWPVKLADGSTDIIPRAFFFEWHADIKLKWDADQFSASDVVNLLSRVGGQVGIGAGRPNSKKSTGMGWGTFVIEDTAKPSAAQRSKAESSVAKSRRAKQA